MLVYDPEGARKTPGDDDLMPSDDFPRFCAPVLIYREIAGDAPLHAALTTVRETRRPHGHDFREAFLVLEGELRHLRNGSEETLRAGALRMIGPEDAHGFAGLRGKLANVAMPASFWREFGALTGTQPTEADDALSHRPAFQAALAAHARGATRCDAAAFLLALSTRGSGRDPGPQWLVTGRAALGDDAALRAGLAAMRSAAGTSDEHLSRVHRLIHGVPPSVYLAERRLARAAELLGGTDLTVAAVAATVGYASTSHFHRAFAARYGLAPGEWRRSGRAFAP